MKKSGHILLLFALLCLCSCSSSKKVTTWNEYMQSLRAEMPFAVDSFYQLNDHVYGFTTMREQHIEPDYVVKPKPNEAFIGTHTNLNPISRELQNPGEIWRNLVISKKNSRIICIDRIIKDGRYGGYAYVMQNDGTPFGSYHWDVTDPINMQMTSHILDDFLAETKDRMKGKNTALKAPKSQHDYWRLIFLADTMTNFNRAEEVLDMAFSNDHYIFPYHLYYYGGRMLYGGHKMAGVRYIKHRIAMEKDFYDDGTDYPQEMLDTFKIRQERYHYNLELKTELEDMMVRDEYHRLQWSFACHDTPQDSVKIEELAQTALATDSMNLARVKELLATQGFPKKKEVGAEACLAVWLVIQHSSLKDQEELLPVLEKAAANGDIAPAYIATLHDRIDVREGHPQKYGTQYGPDGKLCPLLDATKVNQWRQEVGLPPIQ